MKEKKNNTEIISPEIEKLINEVMSKQNSASRGRTLIGDKSRRDALTPPTFRNRHAPIKLIEEDYVTAHPSTHHQNKFPNKKLMPKPRVAFVYDEATKLRRDRPTLDKVEALKKINLMLKIKNY